MGQNVSQPIPAVILAGGRGARMGGADKALLPLAGRPLVAHLIARLAPQCGALAINAGGDPSRFAFTGLPVLGDEMPDQPGPLAGILAALDWAAGLGAGLVITAAVDTPFLPADLVERLRGAAGPSGAAIAASPDAEGEMRLHPVFGLWPVASRDDLRARLAAGERKAMLWARAQGVGVAEFSALPFDPFLNINAPEDLRAAEALASR
ncbi:MAG: molybdenum cofactor guanylyltransferase MobA [Proteobacteria bacterium]|nr:molybdenum cofactor guanylyltransferase MobA [Pseudomonadota bacterium]